MSAICFSFWGTCAQTCYRDFTQDFRPPDPQGPKFLTLSLSVITRYRHIVMENCEFFIPHLRLTYQIGREVLLTQLNPAQFDALVQAMAMKHTKQGRSFLLKHAGLPYTKCNLVLCITSYMGASLMNFIFSDGDPPIVFQLYC